MSNLTVTQRLGTAIRRLQNGWWLAKVRRGRSYYQIWWMTQQGGETVEAELIDELKKHKLISERAFSPYGDRNLYHVRGTRRIYEATDHCKSIKLPPETLWVPDEHSPPAS